MYYAEVRVNSGIISVIVAFRHWRTRAGNLVEIFRENEDTN